MYALNLHLVEQLGTFSRVKFEQCACLVLLSYWLAMNRCSL